MMSYLEIDLHALKGNFHKIQDWVGSETQLMPIVKSNAYGHGLLRCVKELVAQGVSWVGVNNVEEASLIRRQAGKLSILILGPIQSSDFGRALSGDFRLTIADPGQLNFLNTQARILGRRANIHIKIDTGMNRFGVAPEQAVDLVEKARNYQNILVEAVYSHFYDSYDSKVSLEQWKKFNEVLFDLQRKGLEVPVRHLANSGAILKFDRSFFEIVRPGVLLYGLADTGRLEVKPVLSWKTKILKIKRIKRGDCVSYGCTFRAKKQTDLAVIGVGYADGYDRGLSNTAQVLVSGRRCRIRGAINMSYAFVDITPAIRVSKKLSPHSGDEVVLIGRQGSDEIRVRELAGWAKTNVHEIVSRIPKEVTRIYQ